MPSPSSGVATRPGCSATVRERQLDLFPIADRDVLEFLWWIRANLNGVGTGLNRHGIPVDDSTADDGGGRVTDLEWWLQGRRDCVPQLVGAGGIEEPAAPDARPLLELLLESLVVDGEPNDVHADVDALIDQLADGSLWISPAGLLTIGNKDDDLRAVDLAQVGGDPLEGGAERSLHPVN